MSVDRAVDLVSQMTEEELEEFWLKMGRRGHLPFARMTPLIAYTQAREIDQPDDLTRRVACGDPMCAYKYAMYVDKGPRDDTREAASQNSEWAWEYATNVDKGPHDVTRKGCCKTEYYANSYANRVDRGFHPLTWKAIQGNPYMKDRYYWPVPEEYRDEH